MQYGTSVLGTYWDHLMERAEFAATTLGGKPKVVAVLTSERERRKGAPKYKYVMQGPQRLTYARCGKRAPNGKPCFLRRGHDTEGFQAYQEHLSRSGTPGKILRWAVINSSAAHVAPKGSIVSIEIDDKYAKDRGMI